MSLVSTYVLCDDGLFYKEPPVGGIIDGVSWMMIWDDDDPPELCIRCKPKDRGGKGEATRQAEELVRKLRERRLRLHLLGYVPCREVGHVWETRLLSLPPVALFEQKRTGVCYPRCECTLIVAECLEGQAAFENAQRARRAVTA